MKGGGHSPPIKEGFRFPVSGFLFSVKKPYLPPYRTYIGGFFPVPFMPLWKSFAFTE